jgi:hypothetical protein
MKLTGFFTLHSHLFYNSIMMATMLVVFLGVPVFILEPLEVRQFFSDGLPGKIIESIFLFVMIFFGLFAAIYWIMTLFRLKIIAAIIVMFAFSWVALAGFLFPLTTASGILPAIEAQTSTTNLLLVLGLASTLTLLSFTRLSKAVHTALAVFIFAATIPSLPGIIGGFGVANNGTEIQLSTEKNIILMSFDGLPGHVAKGILENDNDLKAAFSDFIFYENAVASAPATLGSQLGIIHGNSNFAEWDSNPPIDWKSLYFNDTEKYDLYTNYTFNLFNQKGTRFSVAKFGTNAQLAELINLYKSVVLRLSTRAGARVYQNFQERAVPKTIFDLSVNVETFDRILNMFTIGNDRIPVVYMHFSFTHFPVVTDENCMMRGTDEKWTSGNQNLNGVKKSTECGMKKFAEFLEKIKEIGAYENSTIFLISDHGKPPTYYDEPPNNFKVNSSEIWGFDRYQPLLMLKAANRSNDGISFNNDYVLLDDIAQTTCYLTENNSSCEDSPGMNLLDEMDIMPSEFFIHVVKPERPNFKIETQNSVLLSRGMPLLDAMRKSDEIELTESITVSPIDGKPPN